MCPQGPRGYKGIRGPVGIAGPPVRTHLYYFLKQIPVSHRRYPKIFWFVCRVKRGLRDHWENQETGETRYGGSPGFSTSDLLAKAVAWEKKIRYFSNLQSDMHCTFSEIVFICRAAEVSRARREQLAKRERM